MNISSKYQSFQSFQFLKKSILTSAIMDVDELKDEFRQRFNCSAKYIVRCPGRVNLIGEHIDYSGYGVLPMAISASTYILASLHDTNEIVFQNINTAFRCYTITGTIPTGAGLSSSSSLVCAAALVTLALHTGRDFDIINKTEFAELCAEVERYVGVEGGGMDQAIEILANEGSAMLIDFNPLRFAPVTLPENALFAVIHSGEALNKAATSQYNERVVECRLAAQIIAKVCELESWKEIRTLGEVAQRLQKTAQEMIVVVEEVLSDHVYTKDNALSLLGISNENFNQTILSANTQHMETFKLAQRAKHVYMEADRVRLFHEACKSGNVEEMGKLMTESHNSCKELFECSCNKLDEVVENCLRNGALGARLTGAGWGGCAVALFDIKQSDLEVLFWSGPASGKPQTKTRKKEINNKVKSISEIKEKNFLNW
uniref:Bm13747, isoform c n=1 Tax=Brugia malayi TaxID=6279 RepID=A0A1I9G0Y9_BRUMA|nr:Bm13747, isoform c [Brugia malayi]